MAKNRRSSKKPKNRDLPATSKRVPSGQEVETRLKWRFARIDFGGPWCWLRMDDTKRQEVYRKLGNHEGTTVAKLSTEKSCGNVNIVDLDAKAQKRLQEIEQDDAGQIFHFRLSGKERVWAIAAGDVLDLLWWDPEHEVCPSPKRNT